MSTISETLPINRFMNLVRALYVKLDLLAPISNLAIRLWVANVFFKSGLTKIQTWDSTLYLFNYEYAVPLLPPDIAAVIGTSIELGMSTLLAFGLLGRFSAIVLFLFNIMAVISYPDLNAAGLVQHQMWGIMLLVAVLQGPGKLSLDYLIVRKFKL